MIEKLIGELDKHDADGTPINMTRWLQFCESTWVREGLYPND
jgi:hypothetical protein